MNEADVTLEKCTSFTKATQMIFFQQNTCCI